MLVGTRASIQGGVVGFIPATFMLRLQQLHHETVLITSVCAFIIAPARVPLVNPNALASLSAPLPLVQLRSYLSSSYSQLWLTSSSLPCRSICHNSDDLVTSKVRYPLFFDSAFIHVCSIFHSFLCIHKVPAVIARTEHPSRFPSSTPSIFDNGSALSTQCL